MARREPIEERRGGRVHYAAQLALYLAARYGMRTRGLEATTGVEMDLGFPAYVVREAH